MTHDLMLFGLAGLVLLAGGFCLGDTIGQKRGYHDGYTWGRLMGESDALIRQARKSLQRRGQ